MIFIIILFIAILLITSVIISNNIKQYEVKVEEAKSDIEVYLIKRYDILMESLKVAKKYIEHEKELMIEITKIRKGMTLDETQKAVYEQEMAFSKLFAIAENYPNLYSNELFKTLQIQISETNEHLAASKRLFNSNVSQYNQYIVTFPNSIIANIIGKKKIDFLNDKNIETKKEINLEF